MARPIRADRDDLLVAEHAAATLDRVELHPLVLAVGPAHDLEGLCADPGVEETGPVLRHHVGIGLDLAAHDHLALAVGGLDHDVVGLPRRGIDGEHDARALRGHHLLDHHGDGRLCGQLLVAAVEDGPRTPQRRPAVDDSSEQLLGAGDVGERLVHAGERRAFGILADARRPHRDPNVGSETLVRVDDASRQVVGDRHRVHETSSPGRQAVEVVLRRGASFGQDLHQPLPGAGPADGIEIGLTCDHESGRHGQASRGQLAQVRTLASYRVCVPQPDVFEPPDFLHHSIVPDQGRCR